MVSNVVLHHLQLIEHLLTALFLQDDFRPNLRLVNICKSGCLNFVFLVLDHICKVLLFASLSTFMLFSLINRAKPLVAFIELGQHVRFIVQLLELLILLFKDSVISVDICAI